MKDVSDVHEKDPVADPDISRESFRKIFDGVNDGIFLLCANTGRVVEVNLRCCQMFGYDRAELVGKNRIKELSSGTPPYTEERALEHMANALRGDPQVVPWQCRSKDGRLFWTEMSVRYLELDGMPMVVTVMRDITERKELTDRFRQLAENISEVFWLTDTDKNTMLYVSPAYEDIWGRSCEELYRNPRQWLDAVHEEDRARIAGAVKLQIHGEFNEEYRIIRPDGELRWIADRAFPVEDERGRVYRVAGIASDITERKDLAAQLERMARCDTLTGLPNRFTFNERIEQAIAHARRTRRPFSLMFLDLDDFKTVNDTKGHLFGDQLLKLVGERLNATLRRHESAFRLGGDEFAILLGTHHPPEIARMAERITGAIREPFVIGGSEVRIGASIGIAIFGQDALDATSLLNSADTALYAAKAEGRHTYRFFSNYTRKLATA